MKMLAAVFSLVVLTASEMVPGFTIATRADRALFFMVAWLCANELFKKRN